MNIYNTWPVSLTIEVLLIKIILFFDFWSIHLLQSNKLFQAIEFVDRPSPEKLDIFCRNRFLSFVQKKKNAEMHGALESFFMLSVESRFFSPVSMVSARNAWDHQPPFGAQTRKNTRGKERKKRSTKKRRSSVMYSHCTLTRSVWFTGFPTPLFAVQR